MNTPNSSAVIELVFKTHYKAYSLNESESDWCNREAFAGGLGSQEVFAIIMQTTYLTMNLNVPRIPVLRIWNTA